MQEEVEQRVVTLAINCTKLTEQELKKALVKLLQHWKMHQQKGPHGKMTVKQLAAQNRGLQSVEVTDQNIGSFKKIARKYGIDFAPYKAKGQDRYLVFFKAQDADAMTAAFKEYTAKTVKQHSRPSVLAKLAQFKELMDCRPVQSVGNRPGTAAAISQPCKSADEVFERSERKEPEVFAALATTAHSRRTENRSGGGQLPFRAWYLYP